MAVKFEISIDGINLERWKYGLQPEDATLIISSDGETATFQVGVSIVSIPVQDFIYALKRLEP